MFFKRHVLVNSWLEVIAVPSGTVTSVINLTALHGTGEGVEVQTGGGVRVAVAEDISTGRDVGVGEG